jgi:predicted SPOUT superfamily RNA methylase MTH1
MKTGSLVDIGVERPVLVPGAQLETDKRVTVKIVGRGRRPRATLTDRGEVGEYWGYRVWTSNASIGELMSKGSFDLVVATSRFGVRLTKVKEGLARRWGKADRVLVAFGSPSEGLQEIMARENLQLEKVADFILNMVPDQGTETVRTEEAIFVCLGLLNCL